MLLCLGRCVLLGLAFGGGFSNSLQDVETSNGDRAEAGKERGMDRSSDKARISDLCQSSLVDLVPDAFGV
ncbi:hypothetical protein KSF_103430 [Reticulibacter mediterranei]|uniref:Uncharacterized protein n=1 Tax=Reticulibacter mediterranei TaxID=2778369 RepID=A0A8J3IXH5_9CHLR|nr:hypothetical protein KSF_103430 [Reticulibacter mediterranei]